jgi:hypothetical protein
VIPATVVDILKGVLAKAELGQVTGIAIATCHDDLCTASAWCMESATLAELLGSVAMLNARLLQQMQEGPG